MSWTLFLPWFPLMVVVGMAGSLLSRGHAMVAGVGCVALWFVCCFAQLRGAPGADGIVVIAVIIAAAALVVTGLWAAELSEKQRRDRTDTVTARLRSDAMGTEEKTAIKTQEFGLLSEDTPATILPRYDAFSRIMAKFDDWLESHRDDADPWPRFDEFLRGVLFDVCGASHVRPYRVLSEDEHLIPLGDAECAASRLAPPIRGGILGHVIASGQSYLAHDPAHGALVDQLAAESDERTEWCFPITAGSRRIGLVAARQVRLQEAASPSGRAFLRGVESLINLCWTSLVEVCRARSAELDDPVSKLLTREAFLRQAEAALQDSFRQGEPAALAVINLERLRELNDGGRWLQTDQLVREVSLQLRLKVRSDDLLGRFDDSRFLVFLRRVDSELATLIVRQLLGKLESLCGESRWNASVRARCGVVGSGVSKPTLKQMIIDAVAACLDAGRRDVPLQSDVNTIGEAGSTQPIASRAEEPA